MSSDIHLNVVSSLIANNDHGLYDSNLQYDIHGKILTEVGLSANFLYLLFDNCVHNFESTKVFTMPRFKLS